jgi:diguanylate cyclase (GGDEF)-like protein
MTHRTVRALVRRWIWRREALPFLPALLLLCSWLGGETALVFAAALFPAVFALMSPGAPARVTVRDGVTGLPLRPALIGALDAAFADARSGKTTVAFAIGIDDFAEVEARHGLHVAEEVQRRVGERVATMLRRGDTVARIGAGVYGVAFGPVARADLETAIQVAGRIQGAVREPILAEAARVHVTCSVGFCLGAKAPRPAGEAALSAALDALDEAWTGGPGAVRAFSTERPREKARAAELEAEAIAALEAGQIRPWFQPQISTDTGAVSGFEALARWEHPKRGVLAPKDFLPTLTAAGQLERLGEVTLFHGLTAMQAWDRAGYRVPSLGVNFSADELRNPRLAEKLAWELDRFDLTPERLTVEILETVMVDFSDDSISRTIAALARMGCRIDLDDFGTGNASLAALKRFSVRRIKIDRSFVINVDEDRDQQLMVTAILGLAERLGLDTLAEGVERVGEHAMLAQLGCGHVQGYGISRPMPFEDTIGWMQRHAEKLKETPTLTRRAV